MTIYINGVLATADDLKTLLVNLGVKLRIKNNELYIETID